MHMCIYIYIYVFMCSFVYGRRQGGPGVGAGQLLDSIVVALFYVAVLLSQTCIWHVAFADY